MLHWTTVESRGPDVFWVKKKKKLRFLAFCGGAFEMGRALLAHYHEMLLSCHAGWTVGDGEDSHVYDL